MMIHEEISWKRNYDIISRAKTLDKLKLECCGHKSETIIKLLISLDPVVDVIFQSGWKWTNSQANMRITDTPFLQHRHLCG